MGITFILLLIFFGLLWLATRGHFVCSACAEKIKKEATVCPHCKRDIKPKKKIGWIGSIVAVASCLMILGSLFQFIAQARQENTTAAAPVIATKPCLETETLRSWYPSHGIGLELLVPETTKKKDVIDLAACLRAQYEQMYDFVQIGIFDSKEAWQHRDDEKYPTKKFMQHYLCQTIINKKTGHNKTNWMAENRKEPK